MIEIDITNLVHKLKRGEATSKEQVTLGIIMEGLLKKGESEEPVYVGDKPYCPKCGQPICTKMKDGIYIHQFCKVCGKPIKWEVGGAKE